jgi:hypothetical protein
MSYLELVVRPVSVNYDDLEGNNHKNILYLIEIAKRYLQSMYFQCFKDLEGAKFFIILLKLHEPIILFLFASHQMSNLNLDFELSSFGFLNEYFYDSYFSIFLN